MYSVTSNFTGEISKRNARIARQFLIGTSDYSQHVLRWPRISKQWDDLRAQAVTIDLSNAEQTFNFLLTDPSLLRSSCQLKMGASFSGTPPKSLLGTVHSGTAQGSTIDGLTLATTATDSANYYAPMTIRVTSGAGAGQARTIKTSNRNLCKFSEDLRNTAEAGATRPWGEYVDADSEVTFGYDTDRYGTRKQISKLSCTTSGSAQRQTYQNFSTMIANTIYTAACDIHADEIAGLSIILGTMDGLYPEARFNATSGSASAYASGSASIADYGIESLSNGWWRCWIACDVRSGTTVPAINLQLRSPSLSTPYSGWPGDGILIDHVHVNSGSLPEDYVRTTSAAMVGITAEFPWSVNEFVKSNDFSNAAWTRQRCSVVNSAIAGPDGLWTACKVVSSNTTGRIEIQQNVPVVAYTKSSAAFSLKAGEFDDVVLFFDDTECVEGGYYGSSVVLNLTTGESSNPNIVTIEHETDGWWRASLHATPTSNYTYFSVAVSPVNSAVGDGDAGFYIAHGHHYPGYEARPYIETGAAGVSLPNSGSNYEIVDSELLTPYVGTMDAVRFNDGQVSITLIDKLRKLSDRKIGDTSSPVSYTASSYLVHDMAWYACTSLGGMSALTSTSNPDIDYQSFSSWTSVFSADNVRVQGEFTGQQPVEVLRKLAALTQSAIFIENDKLKFTRFSIAATPSMDLMDDTVLAATATLDDRDLINRAFVSGAYDVTSRSFSITVKDESSDSMARYGMREKLIAESFIWLTDSVSTLSLAQRMIITGKEMQPRYSVRTPFNSALMTIGDAVLFEDSLLQISDSFRIMADGVDMETGTKTFEIDQSQYFGSFRLDISALDSSDVLT